MNVSRKILGFALSVAIIGTQFTTAFAASTDPASTNAGDGYILDYTVETVVVPTAIKIALNPNGYKVRTNYLEADAWAADTVYYTESAGVYTKAATQPTSSNFATGGPYYTKAESTDQIVSLNYGLANKSTEAKNISVTVTASYTAEAEATRTKDITFTATENEAKAYVASGANANTQGAQPEELKMYLALTPSTAAPTSTHYYYSEVLKSIASEYSNTLKYYKNTAAQGADPVYAEVTISDQPALAASTDTLYIKTKTIRQDATTKQLSDVAMTKSAGGIKAFSAGDGNSKAVIAYKLSDATYSLKDDADVTFTTTQAQMADNVYCSAMGGTAAFTITGAMNKIADWSKAKASKVVFTPTYKVSDPDGSEVDAANTNNGYNEILVSTAPNASTSGVIDGTAVVINYDLGSGTLAATSVTSVDITNTNKGDSSTVNSDRYTIDTSAKTITIKSDYMSLLYNDGYTSITFMITFDNSATASVTVTN